MVDWDGLENRSRCKPTVGSNPTPSALSDMFTLLARLPGLCTLIGLAH